MSIMLLLVVVALLTVGTSFKISPRLNVFKRTLRASFGDEFDASKPVKPEAPATPKAAVASEEVADSTDTVVPIEAEEPAAVNQVVPVEPKEVEISSNMKDKLRRELESQGANPNVAGANPILIIGGIVALLVVVGGQGFFY